jgi:ferredoxin-type protein NapF
VAQASDACLARQRVECRICADTCPQGAWRFVPVPGGVAQPQLDPAACNGCGECVAPCPVGAIQMGTPGR